MIRITTGSADFMITFWTAAENTPCLKVKKIPSGSVGFRGRRREDPQGSGTIPCTGVGWVLATGRIWSLHTYWYYVTYTADTLELHNCVQIGLPTDTTSARVLLFELLQCSHNET